MQRQPPAASANPFALQASPEAAIAHAAWEHARAAALGVVGSGGAGAVLGQPGSGKSLLLKHLARRLRAAGHMVQLLERPDAPVDAAGGGVLLVDEADRADQARLDALLAVGGPVLLAGLPAFRERLGGLARGVTPIALAPMRPDDVARFVMGKLAAAAQPVQLFEPEAVLALARCTGGSARLVTVLAGAALFTARLGGSPTVSTRHVEEAASMRELPAWPEPGPAAAQPEAVAMVDGPIPSDAVRRRVALGAWLLTSGAVVSGALALPWWLWRRPPAEPAVAPPLPAPSAAAPAMASKPAPASMPGPTPVQASVQAPVPTPVPTPVPAPTAAAPPALAIVRVGGTFRGAIYNDTMGQGGHLILGIVPPGADGAVTARFAASQGLSGAGVLSGRLSPTGQIKLSGQLLMGRNPFACDLAATLDGDRLIGSAVFVRGGSGAAYHGRFNLARA